MADYSQYNSTNNAYNFSKGPKSLYSGLGDDALLTAVLNVPQTDTDDEWGGTERIAMEVVIDEVGRLQEAVKDPAGAGVGGLLHKMDLVVGATGGAPGVIDLTLPSMTMGTVVINGVLDKITIGSTAEFTATSFKLNTDFLISGTSTSYSIAYRKDVLTFGDDGVSTPYVSLSVNSNVYRFDGAGLLTVPNLTVIANLTVIGTTNFATVSSTTVSATTINFKTLAVVDTTSNIGTTGTGQVNNLYARNIFGEVSTFTGLTTMSGAVLINNDLSVDSSNALFQESNFLTINIGSVASLSISTLGLTYTGPAIAFTASMAVHGTFSANSVTANYLITPGYLQVGTRIDRTSASVDIGASGSWFNSLYIQNVLLYNTLDSTTFNVGYGGINFTGAAANFTTAMTVTGNLTVNGYYLGTGIALGSFLAADSSSVLMEVSNFVTINIDSLASMSVSSTGLTFTGATANFTTAMTVTGNLTVTGSLNATTTLAVTGVTHVGAAILSSNAYVDLGNSSSPGMFRDIYNNGTLYTNNVQTAGTVTFTTSFTNFVANSTGLTYTGPQIAFFGSTTVTGDFVVTGSTNLVNTLVGGTFSAYYTVYLPNISPTFPSGCHYVYIGPDKLLYVGAAV